MLSGVSNLSVKLNEVDRKMEALWKNYMSIFQTVLLFAVLIVIVAFVLYILYVILRGSRRVISLTEMSNLHMEH